MDTGNGVGHVPSPLTIDTVCQNLLRPLWPHSPKAAFFQEHHFCMSTLHVAQNAKQLPVLLRQVLLCFPLPLYYPFKKQIRLRWLSPSREKKAGGHIEAFHIEASQSIHLCMSHLPLSSLVLPTTLYNVINYLPFPPTYPPMTAYGSLF